MPNGPRRLIVCCDGTWKSEDHPERGRQTNVAHIKNAIAEHDAQGRRQLTYYQPGVGTSHWERIRGGAFGYGLSREVRAAYRFLVQNFRPGDEVFLFGFSRGAFTVRSTAGLVRNCGILRGDQADRVDEAYELYRSRNDATRPNSAKARAFRESYARESRIRFIGVWDTVGALGIPVTGLGLSSLINRRWQFHDTELSATVDAAFQALAIDEKRGPFRPTLWKRSDEAVDQRLEQAWFAGVHSDVGGGYSEAALAEITLRWMADKARSYGLAFDGAGFNDPFDVAGRELGVLHDSRRLFFRLLPASIRPIGVNDRPSEYAASTAISRHAQDRAYAPVNLVGYLKGEHRVVRI